MIEILVKCFEILLNVFLCSIQHTREGSQQNSTQSMTELQIECNDCIHCTNF